VHCVQCCMQVWLNEFDLGFRRNLTVTLGLTPLRGWALLFPLPVRMPGDGMSFPTVHTVTPRQVPPGHPGDSRCTGSPGGSTKTVLIPLFERRAGVLYGMMMRFCCQLAIHTHFSKAVAFPRGYSSMAYGSSDCSDITALSKLSVLSPRALLVSLEPFR